MTDRVRDSQRQLVKDVRARIGRGDLAVGDKLLSIPGLREQYGATQHEVVTGLQQLIEVGLIESRPRSGYFVRDEKVYTGRVLVSIPESHVGQVVALCFNTVRTWFQQQGYEVFLLPYVPDRDEMNAADGMLYFTGVIPDLEAGLTTPVVCLGLNHHGVYDSVTVDDNAVARQACEELYRQGYERIGFAGPSVESVAHDPSFIARQAGAITGMLMQQKKPVVVTTPHNHWFRKDDSNLLRQWLSEEDLEAVICPTDTLATQLHDLCTQHDIYGVTIVSLTTGVVELPTNRPDHCFALEYPIADMARIGAKRLLQRMRGDKGPACLHLIPPRLLTEK